MVGTGMLTVICDVAEIEAGLGVLQSRACDNLSED